MHSKELNGKARRNGAWGQRAWWKTPGLSGNWAGRLAAAELVIAKHQRPPKCPSAGGGYRVRPAHSMEYCVAVKMNEIELYVPTRVILQSHLRAKAILPELGFLRAEPVCRVTLGTVTGGTGRGDRGGESQSRGIMSRSLGGSCRPSGEPGSMHRGSGL